MSVTPLRTEGSFMRLEENTQFFTLYANDFINSTLNDVESGASVEDTFRLVEHRYHLLTV